MPVCERCGREVGKVSFSPTKTSRVTGKLKHGTWLCKQCLSEVYGNKCGKCVRYQSFYSEGHWLGHCKVANKNVNITAPGCDHYIDEETLDVFQRLFVNRMDTYAVQREDNSYVRVNEPFTKEVLKLHLKGEITVGLYQLSTGNMVSWLCYDIDPERHDDPLKVAEKIYKAAKSSFHERSVLLECSRYPDQSFHVWVFFLVPLPAKVAKYLGERVLEKASVSNVELFPKQTEIGAEGFGNLVKAPLGLHRKEGKWSAFLDPSTVNSLSSSCLLNVECTSLPEKDIEHVMALTEGEKRSWFDRPELAQKRYRGKDPACILGLAKGVSEGWRNEAAIRLAAYMVNFKQLKSTTVWKRLVDWNLKNKPPLNAMELRTVFKSASEKEYVFGCDDELLKKFCVREGCRLAKELSGIELIREELARAHALHVHPLMDYHPDMGLTIGALLGESSQALIFMAEKAFTAEFETPLLEEGFAHSVSVTKPKWAELTPNLKRQMLILAGDFLKDKQIDFPSKNEVFQKVLEKASYYYWHSDKRWLVLITCWTIGTYFHTIFVFFPALCLQGERATGKTTLLEVLRKIAWNATGREVALREADLFRTIQDSRVTYLADITKLNPRSSTYQDVVDVFETGTEKGGCVRRIDKDTEKPMSWKTFGPKAIATRYELAFLPKTIRIITEKMEDPVYSERRAEIEFDEEFSEIVGCIIKATIKYWPEVVEAYKSMKQTEKLRGRPFNYWSPVLAVCKVFASEHYDSLLELAEEEAEKAERGDLLSEVEECVLAILLAIEGKTTAMLLKELTQKVQERVSWVKSWHIVKSAIVNLGISKERYQTSEGLTYRFDLDRVKKKAETRSITLEEAPQETEKRYGNCEVCGKPGARGILRDGHWRYVHPECEGNWLGPL